MRKRLTIAIVLVSVLAPACVCQTERTPSWILLDSISTSVFRSVAMHCQDYRKYEFHEVGLLKACVGSSADTQYVAYTTHLGKPLAVTRTFYVQNHRLPVVVDSLRNSLTKLLGEGKECPNSLWTGTVERVTQWHDGPLTVQVGLDSTLSPYQERKRIAPWVGIQIVAEPLACDHWVGPPGHR